MAADFKSHVLLRDEKGFVGIPFKRLLLAGTSGGMGYVLMRFASPGLAIPVGLVVGLAVLLLTGIRGGLPFWQRGLYHLRGSLLLAAGSGNGFFAGIARQLDLPLEVVVLDGAQVFAPPQGGLEVDMREWVTFAHADEADHDDGLVFIGAPLETNP